MSVHTITFGKEGETTLLIKSATCKAPCVTSNRFVAVTSGHWGYRFCLQSCHGFNILTSAMIESRVFRPAVIIPTFPAKQLARNYVFPTIVRSVLSLYQARNLGQGSILAGTWCIFRLDRCHSKREVT